MYSFLTLFPTFLLAVAMSTQTVTNCNVFFANGVSIARYIDIVILPLSHASNRIDAALYEKYAPDPYTSVKDSRYK